MLKFKWPMNFFLLFMHIHTHDIRSTSLSNDDHLLTCRCEILLRMANRRLYMKHAFSILNFTNIIGYVTSVPIWFCCINCQFFVESLIIWNKGWLMNVPSLIIWFILCKMAKSNHLVTKSHYTYNYMYMYIPYDLYHAQMDIDQSIH